MLAHLFWKGPQNLLRYVDRTALCFLGYSLPEKLLKLRPVCSNFFFNDNQTWVVEQLSQGICITRKLFQASSSEGSLILRIPQTDPRV